VGTLKKRWAAQQAAVRERVDAAVAKVEKHAEHEEPGWAGQALRAVRAYALTHDRFLAEHVELPVPEGVTRRAVGAIMPKAARAGWITADGYALDHYGSPKTCWRSLIFKGAR
jgi:hypothetical protein